MKSKNSLISNFNIKSFHHFLMLAVISFSLISFAGCGSDSSTSAGSDPNPNNEENEEPVEEQADNEVWIEGNSFNVSNLEITAGTTVTWKNNSNADHTITSGTRNGDDAGELFDRSISPGQTVSITFEEAGTYEYFCKIHSGMDAEVTVSE